MCLVIPNTIVLAHDYFFLDDDRFLAGAFDARFFLGAANLGTQKQDLMSSQARAPGAH